MARGQESSPEGPDAPPIFLLTMGPDHSVIFRKWGHAALCVGDQCLNYGVTDFSRPAGLVREVLRGEAVFWLGVSAYEDMVGVYARDDRSVFRQDLDLSPEARDALLGRIAQDLVPGASEYIYNHFNDNCTSRIRDYLDEATSGRLRDPIPLPLPFETRGKEPTFRGHIRRGLSEDPFLLWLSDVGVGSVADEPISSFDAMFLPGAFRYGVEQTFGAPPRRLHTGGYGDLLPPDPGSRPYLPWIFGIAGLLALAILFPGNSGVRRSGVISAATLMTLVGAVATAVLVLSPLPEFRTSAIAFAVPPTDVLLTTRHARWYGPARLVWGVGFLLAIAVGFLRQPLGWTVFATLLPLAAIVWRSRRPVEGRQPVAKPTRSSSPGGGSTGDPSRLNRPPTGRTGAMRRSSLRFGRNTPGIPASRALSAGPPPGELAPPGELGLAPSCCENAAWLSSGSRTGQAAWNAGFSRHRGRRPRTESRSSASRGSNADAAFHAGGVRRRTRA